MKNTGALKTVLSGLLILFALTLAGRAGDFCMSLIVSPSNALVVGNQATLTANLTCDSNTPANVIYVWEYTPPGNNAWENGSSINQKQDEPGEYQYIVKGYTGGQFLASAQCPVEWVELKGIYSDKDQGIITTAKLDLCSPDITLYAYAFKNYDGPIWEVIMNSASPTNPIQCEVKSTPNSRSFRLEENSGSGTIVVKAKHPAKQDYIETVTIAVEGIDKPSSCSQCENAGAADAQIGCVMFNISLGYSIGGNEAGYIQLFSENPSPDLATPKGLFLAADPAICDIVMDAEDPTLLRQVMAPEALADIVVADETQYQIAFYLPDDVEAFYDSNGYYVVKSGASPFVAYTFDNPSGQTNDVDSLDITETRGQTAHTYAYEYSSPGGVPQWTLAKDNGNWVETLSKEQSGSDMIELRTLRNGDSAVVSKTETTFSSFPWSMQIAQRVQDPDGDALTTDWTYYEEPENSNSYSRLKSATYPDGSWTRREYDENGLISAGFSPWADAGIEASEGQSVAEYNSYTPVDPNDTGALSPYTPRTVTRKICGTTVGKSFFAAYTNSAGDRVEIREQAASPTAAYGAEGNRRTTSVYLADLSSLSGRLKSVTHPDGRFESYTYQYGTYATNGPGQGTFTPGGGEHVRQTLTHSTTESTNGVAYKTTREITISDPLGRTLLSETYAYDGAAYSRIAWTEHSLDVFGRPATTYSSDGTLSEATWGCCGKEWEQNAQGIEMSHTYDALKRLTQSVKTGAGEQPDVYFTYTYDAEGRQLSQIRSAGGISLTSSNEYDIAGRLVKSVNESGLATTHVYSDGGRTETVTLPGGATRITSRYKDGNVKSITGTGVVPKYYAYGVNEDGSQWETVYTGATNSPVWEKTTTDLLGRKIKTEKPGYTQTLVTQNFFDNSGRLVKTTRTGRPDTLNEYDSLGNLIRSGLDVNANASLDLASSDRIMDSDTSFAYESGDWWQVSSSVIYPTDGSSTPKTNSIAKTKLTSLSASESAYAVSIDLLGNETVQTTAIDRDNKTVTQTVNVPDSVSNLVSVTVNGLRASSTSKSGPTTTFGYDALERQTSATDPRTGASLTHYAAIGRVDYVVDAAGSTNSYTYDSATGRKTSEIKTLNAGSSATTYYSYTTRGLLEKKWGGAEYPVSYEFDSYDRQTRLKTYRGGSGWTGNEWPASPGTADETEWAYHEATGLLLSKTDAADKSVTYTYDSTDRVAARAWARTSGTNSLTTTFSYDSLDQITGVDYSDSTPDGSYAFDRLGRQTSAESAVSAHTFAYNANLQLESETILNPQSAITNTITRSYDSLGRPTGLSLDSGYSVSYSYDNYGRFSSVSNSSAPFAPFCGQYSYLENSDIISGLSFDNGLIVTRSYESTRNLLTEIENEFDSETISCYTYANDSGGRRTSVKYTGTAFIAPSFNLWDYDQKSQLTGAGRYWGSDTGDTNSPVGLQSFGYAYDNIGNRTTVGRSGASSTYTANALNQYSQRTVPGVIDLLGSASTQSTVTVNSQSVSRQEEYWYLDFLVTNIYNAVYTNLEITAVYTPPDTNDPDIVTTVTGKHFVALSPEAFTYDDDGNMLSNGRFSYTWDCENRMISAQTLTNLPANVPRVLVEFDYDYQSRRAAKRVYAWDSGITNWSLAESRAFVYDGGKLLSELITDNQSPITNYYVHGLDLSGTLAGAGGIGGLLAATKGTNIYFATYDGNGNVSEYLSTSGEIVAHYEYDPFGNQLVADGELAHEFLHRFSTKPYEENTALVLYEFRIYLPSLARWLSKDPIGEQGGVNLYCFVKNNFINKHDYRGLFTIKSSSEKDGGITLGECGKFTWVVGLKTDENDKLPGYFVQKIISCQKYSEIKLGDHPLVKVGPQNIFGQTYPAWEAFQRSNAKQQNQGNFDMGPDRGDMFQWKNVEQFGTKGWIEFNAEVVFFSNEGEENGSPPGDWEKSQTVQPPFMGNWVIYSEPRWWKDLSSQKHEIKVEWDCTCNSKAKTRVVSSTPEISKN